MKEDNASNPISDPLNFATRVSIVLLLVCLFAALALTLWKAAEVLLLFFAGALLAVILRTAARPISRWTKLRTRWSLTLVLVLFFQ